MARRLALVAAVLLCACAADDDRTPVATSWQVETVSDDQRTLDLIAHGGGCQDTVLGVDTRETEQRVTILVMVEGIGSRDCTDIGIPLPVTVVLDDPLGSRVLSGCRPEPSPRAEDPCEVPLV